MTNLKKVAGRRRMTREEHLLVLVDRRIDRSLGARAAAKSARKAETSRKERLRAAVITAPIFFPRIEPPSLIEEDQQVDVQHAQTRGEGVGADPEGRLPGLGGTPRAGGKTQVLVPVFRYSAAAGMPVRIGERSVELWIDGKKGRGAVEKRRRRREGLQERWLRETPNRPDLPCRFSLRPHGHVCDQHGTSLGWPKAKLEVKKREVLLRRCKHLVEIGRDDWDTVASEAKVQRGASAWASASEPSW